MDSEEECAAAAVIIAIISKSRKKPWLTRRSELGINDTLLQELRFKEINEYKKFFIKWRGYIPQALLFLPYTYKILRLFHFFCLAAMVKNFLND